MTEKQKGRMAFSLRRLSAIFLGCVAGSLAAWAVTPLQVQALSCVRAEHWTELLEANVPEEDEPFWEERYLELNNSAAFVVPGGENVGFWQLESVDE